MRGIRHIQRKENPHEPLERAVEEKYAGLPPFLSLVDVVDCVGISSLNLRHIVRVGRDTASNNNSNNGEGGRLTEREVLMALRGDLTRPRIQRKIECRSGEQGRSV